jgi:hypothetical protein
MEDEDPVVIWACVWGIWSVVEHREDKVDGSTVLYGKNVKMNTNNIRTTMTDS